MREKERGDTEEGERKRGERERERLIAPSCQSVALVP